MPQLSSDLAFYVQWCIYRPIGSSSNSQLIEHPHGALLIGAFLAAKEHQGVEVFRILNCRVALHVSGSYVVVIGVGKIHVGLSGLDRSSANRSALDVEGRSHD